MNNKVSVFGQRRAGVYLLSEIYNPDDVTSSVQNINKIVPAIGSMVVDDTVGNHNTLYVVYSVDAITHRSTLVPAGILDTTDDANLNFSYGNNNYKLFYSEVLADPVYYKTQDTAWKAGKDYYTWNGAEQTYNLFMGNSFVSGTTYYEAVYCYEVAVDSRLAIYNNKAESFTVFRSTAIDSTTSNDDVISWFYKLTDEESNAIDPSAINIVGNYVYDSKIPLTEYKDTTITNSGVISSRKAKSTRYFYTPFELKKGEKYLLIVYDGQNRTVAQVVLEGQPMLALQELNEKYRVITAFDIWTADDASQEGRGVYIPRGRSTDALQFYFNITYSDGSVDQLPGVDNIRLFAYGLEDIDIYAPAGTKFPILFKYFVPSVEQTGLDEDIPRNYQIGPTKRYIYKTVYAIIVTSVVDDTTKPYFSNWILTSNNNPYSTTDWTRYDVNIEAVFADDIGVVSVMHKTEDSDWVEGATVTMENNGIVIFKASDARGNWSDPVEIEITKIDKTPPAAPTVTKSPTVLTKLNVAATLTPDPTDHIAKNQWSTDRTNWYDFSSTSLNTYTTSSNGTFYFRSVDMAGNASEYTECNISNIDNILPTIEVSHVITNNVATVTASISNIGDGKAKSPASAYPRKRIEYQIKRNGESAFGSWKVYSTPFPIEDNCTINFAAYDGIHDGTEAQNGNRGELLGYQITGISTSVPRPTMVQDTSAPTSGNVIVTITYDQNVTGYYYKSDNAVPGGPSAIPDESWIPAGASTKSLTITSNQTVYAKATNRFGSEYESLDITNIDKTSPIISNILASNMNSSNVAQWTKDDVTVTADFSDNVELLKKQYFIPTTANMSAADVPENSWINYPTAGVTVNKNSTILFRAIDTANNKTTASFNVTKIDKTKPVFDASNSTPVPSNYVKNWEGVANFTDTGGSGIDYIEWQAGTAVNNNNWINQSDEYPHTNRNCKIFYRAYDKVGNMSDVTTLNITMIDNDPPVFSDIDFSNKNSSGEEIPTNQPVTVTALVRDTGSGVDKVFYRVIDMYGNVVEDCVELQLGDDGGTGYYPVSCQVSRNGTVQFRAGDKLSNWTPLNNVDTHGNMIYFHTITMFNNTKPSAPSVTPDITAETTGNVKLTASWNVNDEINMNTLQYFRSDTALTTTNIADNDSRWTDIPDNPHTVDSNGYYYFHAKNIYGTWSYAGGYHVSNILRTLDRPSITMTKGTAYENANGYVKSVTLTISDDKGADSIEYSTDGTHWTTATKYSANDYASIPVTTEDVDYLFRGRKLSTILSETTPVQVRCIDVTAPTIAIGALEPANRTHDSVRVNVSITDGKSGVKCKAYALKYDTTTAPTESDWVNFTGNYITVSSNCRVYFRAQDNCENKSDGQGSTSSFIDISNILNYTLEEPTFEQDIEEETLGPVKVKITYPENSVESSRMYSLDNSTWILYSTVPASGITISSKCTVYAKCNDGTQGEGSSSESSWVVDNIIDGNVELSVNTVYQPGNTEATVTATLTPANEDCTIYWLTQWDAISDLTNPSLVWTEYTGPITATLNGHYYFKAVILGEIVDTYDEYLTEIDEGVEYDPWA